MLTKHGKLQVTKAITMVGQEYMAIDADIIKVCTHAMPGGHLIIAGYKARSKWKKWNQMRTGTSPSPKRMITMVKARVGPTEQD